MAMSIAFTSEEHCRLTLTQRREMGFLHAHGPTNYDFFFDQVRSAYYIKGEPVRLTDIEIRALFLMATKGAHCIFEMLYQCMYLDFYDKLKRGKADVFLGRLRKTMKDEHEITIKRFSLAPSLRFCLLYTQAFEDQLLYYYDLA
ncbi:hypothetical protein [Aneurinibacillus tyrosinisolvens]|uniref:hypothetical protein n=1 Tax=Aneurinibacillus tyrosinisolvens TaxID=1443435 RepID=UPI000AB0ABD4|nr:hypothetical protein [Aneurinibacillus tyrosinisolvens]